MPRQLWGPARGAALRPGPLMAPLPLAAFPFLRYFPAPVICVPPLEPVSSLGFVKPQAASPSSGVGSVEGRRTGLPLGSPDRETHVSSRTT